jgi:RNA polymerase sigma factor (sigma-70 family)
MGHQMQTEQEWRAWLHRQALRFTCCHDEANDLVQQTLLAFWKRFGRLPWEQRHLETAEYQQICGWCCKKLRSLALDSQKRASYQHEMLILDDALRGEWLVVASDEEALVERLGLEEFLASLPAYLRRVAELYNEGYRYTEITAQLGVSVGTVQGYLGRIRALGRAFFGVDGNKRALDVVNKSGSPTRDTTDPNQVEEVWNDEAMEDEDADSISGFATDSDADDNTEPGNGSG